jgi:monooxygenase
MEHIDVLIVGAGLSGIGAAVHLQRRCPARSVAIVEARERLGGTWDLFRYPGVRSDSDMFTLGYGFKPWREAKAIADGPSIWRYLDETAREHGIDRQMRFGHRVKRAAWSTPEARWVVALEVGEARTPLNLSCGFLFMCSGYYRYDVGHCPEFAGAQDFTGVIVHPQHWGDEVVHAGRRVVVIGSGATAVTLAPELAKTAAQVTLLQRSPGYVISRPARDRLANGLRRVLPARLAHPLARWKQVLLTSAFYQLCQRRPRVATRLLLAGVRAQLSPGFDIAQHFTPRYKPWEQRLCLVPDGDLFEAIRSKKVEVVTDTVERFTAGGVRLVSGREIAADLIVTATGLALELMGGIEVTLDGAAVDWSKRLNYKGAMVGGVPNFATVFGYTNASWTLKSDLISTFVCRVLNRMARRGLRECRPLAPMSAMPTAPWTSLSSGYLQRDIARFPKQGAAAPWKLHQNYFSDLAALRFGRVDDGVLRFR